MSGERDLVPWDRVSCGDLRGTVLSVPVVGDDDHFEILVDGLGRLTATRSEVQGWSVLPG